MVKNGVRNVKIIEDTSLMAGNNNVSQLAKELGKRGGGKTKKRGSAYYRRIGRLGLAKRYNNPALLEEKK